ncbi:MAG: UDP-2,3-diacylglucosamine diphosphatase LpxI [Marinosulfonomonas sp.]|nr:UDP-2,3-diacylglucosamine diphosphatase LpxI [Marinosulfonomonas sp.]
MLAIIAGEGALPNILYRHLCALGQTPLIVELDGFPAAIPTAEKIHFRIEHLGSLLADLKARGITELCLAGHVQRPNIDPGQIDALTAPFVPAIAKAIQAGDDGALRAIVTIFEGAGFAVCAADEILPGLLPAAGVPSQIKPGQDHQTDATRASQIVAALGAVDVGQGCVVAKGQALALEGFGGTDWMLATLADGRRPAGPEGGLFYKAPKPGQDLRVDLPVIGPQTVAAVAAAGLDGIVIAAGGVMVLDADETVKACDAHGVFLWIREAG